MFIAILCIVSLLFSSCESREDKQVRAAQENASRAAADADRARQEYEDLSENISNYYRLKNALDNAK